MTLSFTIDQSADSDAGPAVGAMQRLKRADIVIAGGGWVGLAMAKEITSRTSLSVVVLERGPHRKMAEYVTGHGRAGRYLPPASGAEPGR